MREKDKLKNIGLIVSIIIILFLSTYIFMLKISKKIDSDYKKFGIGVKDYDIEYYTVYNQDILSEYKVYKVNNSSIKDIKSQLESSKLWSRDKYYEYIMAEFYEIKDSEKIPIDREDVYYYENGYAIFDVKNAKLYYFSNRPFNHHEDYHESLGLNTRQYAGREIYSVRGGPQGDGTDYYVYNFNKEKGKEISTILDKRQNWNKEKLENDILDCFEHNSEIFNIQNGYYHYEKVCRTSDTYKKEHFTDEEATGYEVGVYDVDNNILYYYWTSY